jgi:hypothetical protein
MARGDVIFYRPANADSIEDLAQGDLDEFAVLAAYSQTIPYTPAFKPWHHVAVSISDNNNSTVIGFAEKEYQPGETPAGGQLANTVLRETSGAPPAGQEADVLRPPAAIAEGLVEECQRQKGTDYAAGGLMPFALITAAWMLPASLPARDRLRTMAFGANAVARRTAPQTESCTTAVAKAVIVARRGSSLSLVEPPVPPDDTFANGFADTAQVNAIRSLIPRLDQALNEAFENELLRLDGDVVAKLRNAALGLPQGRLASIGSATEDALDGVVDVKAL